MIDDPLALAVQMIAVLAAGMYPVGFMFGVCSACCCSNDTCEGFDLEEAFSCRHGGTQLCFRGPDRLTLRFTSLCFGSGAAGTAQAPGEDVGGGPITSVQLTAGGSGYARLGRTTPTLTLTNAAEEPATVTFNLSQQTGSCNLPYWTISSATVTDGGGGYTDGQSLLLSIASGDTQEVAATGTLFTAREEPTLEASGGGSATFNVTVASNGNTPETWGVTGVTFSGETSGWTDGEYLTFAGDGVTEGQAASVQVFTERGEPEVFVEAEFSTGNGAVIEATLTQTVFAPSPAEWEVSALSIVNGGEGYQVGNFVDFYRSDFQQYGGYGNVTAVDENGAITAVAINAAFGIWANNDIIESVVVNSGGAYYNSLSGELVGISITNGGRYYREDASLPAILANVTVSILPSGGSGSGAEVTAEIEDDPTSPTFGSVISLTLVNGGNNYFGWFQDDIEHLGSNKLKIGAQYRFISKGCRVSGPGVPDNTVVTDVRGWSPGWPGMPDPAGEMFFEYGDRKGCCRYKMDRTLNSTGTLDTGVQIQRIRTEAECEEDFDEEDGGDTLVYTLVSKYDYSWTECESCPESQSETTKIELTGGGKSDPGDGGYEPELFFIVTLNNSITPEGGCLTFCGSSGLCGPFSTRPSDERPGYGSEFSEGLRRMCVRWLCRCYEGTGKRSRRLVDVTRGCCSVTFTYRECDFTNDPEGVPSGAEITETVSLVLTDEECQEVPASLGYLQCDGALVSVERNWTASLDCNGATLFTEEPEFPDPADWYTVESTTEVGGPVVFGGTITEKLEAAEATGEEYDTLEQETLFSGDWAAEDGERFCLIYAFVFYGSSSNVAPDTCRSLDSKDPEFFPPRLVEPRDAYQIIPCSRCSCR